MMMRLDLISEVESIIATLSLLVFHFGKSVKIGIEGETEEELKVNKEMYEQNLRFLGSVGLITEYKINNNTVDVTVSPDIIGFYISCRKEINLIIENSEELKIPEITYKAFAKMFPTQDKEHCSNCCPELEDDEDE